MLSDAANDKSRTFSPELGPEFHLGPLQVWQLCANFPVFHIQVEGTVDGAMLTLESGFCKNLQQ